MREREMSQRSSVLHGAELRRTGDGEMLLLHRPERERMSDRSAVSSLTVMRRKRRREHL